MMFNDKIRDFADKVIFTKSSIDNVESTKTSLVLPFLNLLGYDVFNPDEVKSGYLDGGVDYAIIKDEKPVMLIKCGNCNESPDEIGLKMLNCKTKYGILTNGVEYQFYLGNAEWGIHGLKPFLIIDLSDLNDLDIDAVSRFSKDKIDTSEELEHITMVRDILNKEFEEPSDKFKEFILSYISESRKDEDIVSKYSHIILEALKGVKIGGTDEADKDVLDVSMREMEAYYTVRGIVGSEVDVRRVGYRKVKSYFSVLLDNNNRKTLCRLRVGEDRLQIQIPKLPLVEKGEKEFAVHYYDSIEDIYNVAEDLVNVVKAYL